LESGSSGLKAARKGSNRFAHKTSIQPNGSSDKSRSWKITPRAFARIGASAGGFLLGKIKAGTTAGMGSDPRIFKQFFLEEVIADFPALLSSRILGAGCWREPQTRLIPDQSQMPQELDWL